MSIHISNKKVNDIHVGTKKVLTTWIGTDRVYLASTLSMLIKGYTEKSGDSLLSANTPLKFTGENLLNPNYFTRGYISASGEFVQSSSDNCSDYININSNNLYYIFKAKIDFASVPDRVAEYDENKNFIRRSIKYTENVVANNIYRQSFKLSPNCKYIRVMYNANYIYWDNLCVSGIQLENQEPYHETLYNPTEGFSLNGFNSIYDTFNTINGELTKRFGVVDLGTANPTSTYFGSGKHQFLYEQLGVKPQTANPANIICSKYPTDMSGKVWADDYGICADTRGIIVQDYNFNDIQTFKEANIGVYAVFELATPQTYQKKPKTLPQWVKHVFDSSGRELEATITQ